MEKNYKRIEFEPGQHIDTAIEHLKSHGELVCADFNGVTLYSDIDDINSAYQKLFGKTQAEVKAEWQADMERYEEEKRQHKEALPGLIKHYRAEGKKVLDKQYHAEWERCVPIRLNDIYRGMELDATLDIIKALNAGDSFGSVKAIVEKQGHSGMSFSLICAMIKAFCDRGTSFVFYLNPKN